MSPPAATATYVYGVVQSRRPPATGGAPSGLPATGPVRVLPAGGDLWLAVADAPLDRYDAAPIERGLQDLQWVSRCAVAHEAVVEYLAASGTVVPLKLFTIFASDARALEHIGRLRRGLARTLSRIAGRAEWGVRIVLDERAALARAAAPAARARTGTAFLAAKGAQREAARAIVRTAREGMEGVFDELAAHADDARRRPPEATAAPLRLLLDAAFLVRTAGAPRFRTAVKAVARRLEPRGCEVTLSGPWPAYSFIAEAR
jgi:hypothetical protein